MAVTRRGACQLESAEVHAGGEAGEGMADWGLCGVPVGAYTYACVNMRVRRTLCVCAKGTMDCVCGVWARLSCDARCVPRCGSRGYQPVPAVYTTCHSMYMAFTIACG